MAISSPGIGSSLDVNSIVSQLMAVESQPLTTLNNKVTSYQAKLSAFGTISSALSTFQTAVSGLSDISKFQALTVTPADATILGATAASGAVAGVHTLEVTKLAQAQSLVAVGQSSTTAAIGAGASTTLSFDFGTIAGTLDPAGTGKYLAGAAFTSNGAGVKTVTIDATNNSLAGIRDAINAANIGVTASIVNDGSATPYRLALSSSSTGNTNSMKISVAGEAAVSSLLANDPAAMQNLSETTTAQNAAFKVDGVSVSKSSNSVNDVIQGVTLKLLKTNAGSPTTLTLAQDTTTVTSSVNAFVKAYNDINKTLRDLSAYNPTTKVAAVLQGDGSVRSMQMQLRNTLTTALTGVGGKFTTLSQIGVTFQLDGTLAVDNTKLQSAISANFSDIASLFAAAGKATDSLVGYTSSTANTKPGNYALTVSQFATNGGVTGTAAAGLTITAGSNDTLNVTVDGISATVTLSANGGVAYTAAGLASEIQSKINGVSAFSSAGISVAVTQTAGVLNLTSNRYGSASNVSVTGGNGQANLNVGIGTAGLDVAGTINGVAAIGSGQYLSGAIGDSAEGLKVQVSGGAFGARGTINYSQGYAYKLNTQITNILSTSGTISARKDGINATIKSINSQQDTMNLRLAATEKRYRAQFSALDSLVSSMTTTSTYLTQQLAKL